MSLQYIIDGYNIINHPSFTRATSTKQARDARLALIQFVISNKSLRNPRNSVTVVFDGFCENKRQYGDYGVKVLFSGELSADEKIKRMIESSANRKNMVAVSDDNQIRLFASLHRVKTMSVEEFIPAPKRAKEQTDDAKTDLTYTQMERINRELRKLWLK